MIIRKKLLFNSSAETGSGSILGRDFLNDVCGRRGRGRVDLERYYYLIRFAQFLWRYVDEYNVVNSSLTIA